MTAHAVERVENTGETRVSSLAVKYHSAFLMQHVFMNPIKFVLIISPMAEHPNFAKIA
jgi:hypothetical protein